MPVIIYKPTTPARRATSIVREPRLSKEDPVKSLVVIKKQHAGRNNQGRITTQHRGGGAKRFLRLVDYHGKIQDQPGRVTALEYDPNRAAFLVLVEYPQGVKSYQLAPEGLTVGSQVVCSQNKIEIKVGNRLPLKYLPTGLPLCNVELQPGRGGQLARSAGSSVTVVAVEGNFAHLKMPSSEIRLVPKDCLATVGQVSNADWRNVRIGKAGRMRHKGIRPTVRGKAKNPVDHPHGGGEGNQSIGLKHPKTPWGKPALGYKTRKKEKYSDRFIIQSRKK